MPQPTTQQFLEFKDIKEGVIILKNNSLRGIMIVSSLNFVLKSEDEQRAIIYQYQNFLNSLDFSVEVLIQSRILNITGYLKKLEELEMIQKNELLKIQIAEYRKFIDDLVSSREVLAKTFFMVIPFTLVEMPKLGKFSQKNQVEFDDKQFQRAKSQLLQRMEYVSLGLRRCGLECAKLKSAEIIELLWSLYHPEESETGYYPEIPPEIIK